MNLCTSSIDFGGTSIVLPKVLFLFANIPRVCKFLLKHIVVCMLDPVSMEGPPCHAVLQKKVLESCSEAIWKRRLP